MIVIKSFTINPFGENCYIVSDETKQAVIIDAGAFQSFENAEIDQYLASQGLTPVLLLLTHGHLDHCFGTRHVYNKYNLPVRIHPGDVELYQSIEEQYERFMRKKIHIPLAPVGELLIDTESIAWGNHSFTVITVPGHSPGGVAFYCEEEKVLFSGDTLFYHSVGRTDLPGGSWEELKTSVEKLLTLPDETKVYPGHGIITSIGDERLNNPYV